MAEAEKDAISKTSTTGHEWDSIKELDTPMPRWWLYTFYATIVWSFAYWAAYPAWPTISGYTKGILGYSSRGALEDDLAAARESRSSWLEKFKTESIETIASDKELLTYAMAGGRLIFAENCAPCHGPGGSGKPGFPVLADDDWLWGGTLEDIKTTIAHGIRSNHQDARASEMPGFAAVAKNSKEGREENEGDDKDDDSALAREDIEALADHVLSLSKADGEKTGKVSELFADNCSACHGEDGKGIKDLGAPNLTDGIWLYGKGREAIIRQISSPRHGVMPAWTGRLDEAAIKQAAIYVHSLGGGK